MIIIILKHTYFLRILVFSLFLNSFLVACSSAKNYQYLLSGKTMGTRYTVKLVFSEKKSESFINDFQVDVQEILNQVDYKMSTYRGDSELSKINRLDLGKRLAVSTQTIEVLAFAEEISRQTEGSFDITIAPLVDLWGFGPSHSLGEKPKHSDIESTLGKLGWNSLSLSVSESTVLKTKHIEIDLSAIAKGYAVDQISNYLKSKNLRNYMVEVGGELFVSGHNQKSMLWRLGIEQPESSNRNAFTTISLKGGGLATSGDYRNYFEQGGKRYSHTIDPKTGYPVRHNLASVSVVAKTCMEADALATALMVMGELEGFRYASERGIKAYFIYRDGSEFASKSTLEFAHFLN